MTSVRLRPPGPLEVGHSARVRQPGLPPATWTVDEVVPGRVFAWTSRAPGVRTRAHHEVTPVGTGSQVRLTIEHSGPGARLAGLVFGRQTRRYLQQELEGLRGTLR